MFYRLRIDLAFTTIPSPDKARLYAKKLLSQAVVINPGEPNEERGYITLERCHHDELPSQPCEILFNHQVPD
ncbi:hypothetical protein ES703_124091 [subsurface metagenome]